MTEELGEDNEPIDQELEVLDDVLAKLTPLEKKYCQILVTQRPKTKIEALIRAGSKGKPQYLGKMAWEMEQRPHVQSYIAHLKTLIAADAGLDIQEIINNARRGIEMAFAEGKPKDADPHNRLLAELGGFIKTNASNNLTQIKVENNLKGESLEGDFKRLQDIAGIG